MAYPNPSARPPHPQQQPQHQSYGEPPRDARAGNWRQYDQSQNESYQQDWVQDGGYQDYAEGYDNYDANAQQYHEGYAARDQGRPNGSNRDMRQDMRHDQGYGDYNGYQEPPGDPRQRSKGRDRQNRPPPQNYPPHPRPTNGDRGPPRPRPPRGPPNGGPPPMNGYGPGPRPPRDPRAMRPPPSQHDRRQLRSEPSSVDQASWDSPFPKWPANPDRSRDRPPGRKSQDQGRHGVGMDQAQQHPRSNPSWEQDPNNNYNGYEDGYGGSDMQQQYDPRRPPEGERRQPPPSQFAQFKDQPANQRPNTGPIARGPNPQRFDMPPRSQTQPTTPVGHSFPRTNSAGPISPVDWQEAQPAFNHQSSGVGQSSLPFRPGTAPGNSQPGIDTNLPRSNSPEEMPAFDRSWSNQEHDPMHTNGGRTDSNTEYIPYSPQDGPAPQKSQKPLDLSRDSQGQQYGPPRNGQNPRIGPNDAPPPQSYGGPQPPQGRPPIRRNATEGAEYEERERAPGPRPGPPPNFSYDRDQRQFGTHGAQPPAPNRQAAFSNGQNNNDPRSAQVSGPDTRNVERPNFYPNAQRDSMAPSPHGQNINGQSGSSRSIAAPGSRADSNRQGPLGQPPKLAELNRRNTDPDALPHHPVPVKPGLGQTGSSFDRQKPAPVRQYNKDSIDQSVGAKSGPVTLEEISRLREAISKNPSDKKMKLLLAKKLSEASTVLADDGGRADQRMRNHNRDRFNKEALEIVKPLAASEQTDAMFFLAECYGEGALGLRSDSKEAFILYQSAAKLGHPAASYRTAVCCEIGAEEGGGTRKDPQKAVQWYKHSSSLGDIPATYKMGVILLKGLLGQEKNMGEAIAYLKTAAENANEENPHALHELAVLYESPNNSMTRDEQHALELYTQAGKLGYKFSQFKLGQAYEYGLFGCIVDARKSIVWYTKAAAQGEHQSELALSGWYLTGSEGILEHNDTEAYLWARKAASADPPLPKAMFAMGYFTEVGIGCPRSLEEAKKWYARSASNRHPKAQERLDELRRGGSKAQKSSREKLSRNNQKQNEENCQVM